jgi:hypothetical protein
MVLMWFSPVWHSMIAVGQDDLEARIKDLRNKAIKAEGEELQTILSRLREALREQSARARDMVANQKRQTARS